MTESIQMERKLNVIKIRIGKVSKLCNSIPSTECLAVRYEEVRGESAREIGSARKLNCDRRGERTASEEIISVAIILPTIRKNADL